MLRRHGVLASAAYRFSILKGRFCFLFQLNGSSYFYFEDSVSTMWQTDAQCLDIQEYERRRLKSWQVIVANRGKLSSIEVE